MDNTQQIINVCKDCLTRFDKLEQKYVKKVTSELEDQYRHIISRWYSDIYKDSNDPYIYHRKGSLKKAYLIKVDDNKINITYDSKYMNSYHHRVSNDYIFVNSFVEGFHGGADGGDNHPNPGTPYWKQCGNFNQWGFRATKSDSPYESMQKSYDKIVKHNDKLFMNEFKKEILTPLLNIIKRL